MERALRKHPHNLESAALEATTYEVPSFRMTTRSAGERASSSSSSAIERMEARSAGGHASSLSSRIVGSAGRGRGPIEPSCFTWDELSECTDVSPGASGNPAPRKSTRVSSAIVTLRQIIFSKQEAEGSEGSTMTQLHSDRGYHGSWRVVSPAEALAQHTHQAALYLPVLLSAAGYLSADSEQSWLDASKSTKRTTLRKARVQAR